MARPETVGDRRARRAAFGRERGDGKRRADAQGKRQFQALPLGDPL